jgi:hypothetical protein
MTSSFPPASSGEWVRSFVDRSHSPRTDFVLSSAGDVEQIFQKGEEGMSSADGFIRQMDSGKTYTQGTDRYGRPVMFVPNVSSLLGRS